MSPLRLSLQILAWLGLMALPASALAESVLVLPAIGDESLRRERGEADAALVETLHAQHLEVVTFDAVRAKLRGNDAACEGAGCASLWLRAVAAQSVVQIALWRDADSAKRRLSIMILRADAARFPADLVVEARGLAAGVASAFAQARQLFALGPGPWLELSGEPVGAHVTIDGRSVGKLPLLVSVQPGQRALVVSADGYATNASTIEVPADAAKRFALQVVLTKRDAAQLGAQAEAHAAPSPAAATQIARPLAPAAISSTAVLRGGPERPSALGPALLGLAGLGLGTFTLASLLDTGCQARGSAGCTRYAELQPGAALALGGASALLLGGAALWYALQTPHAVAERPLAVSVSPVGVTLHGRL